jgi:hypothetical protein
MPDDAAPDRPEVQQIAEYVRLLRDRADSYWRDSAVFQEDGDLHAAVAYKMIAEELRRCAEEMDEPIGAALRSFDLSGENLGDRRVGKFSGLGDGAEG